MQIVFGDRKRIYCLEHFGSRHLRCRSLTRYSRIDVIFITALRIANESATW